MSGFRLLVRTKRGDGGRPEGRPPHGLKDRSCSERRPRR